MPTSPRGSRSRPLVLLDANALFLPLTSAIDLAQEAARSIPGAEVKVPTSVLRELQRLVRRRVAHARAALDLAGKFPELPTDLDGDAAIETLARDLGAWVVTGDRELRHRLTAQGIGVLFPRAGHTLAPSRMPP